MQAMVLRRPGQLLALITKSDLQPRDNRVYIRVSACGVCRSDLHVVDANCRTSHFLLFRATKSPGECMLLALASIHCRSARVGVL
jgi:propanol-preferring alcohol dehydrogenase